MRATRCYGFALACAGSLLLACAGPGGVTPEATVQQERLRSWQKLCDERGFARGTSDFDACVMGYDRGAVDPPVR
jgi:hypothetical protein